MVHIFLAAALNFIVLARAPPGPIDPAISAFFHSLKDPRGQSCCGDPDPDCRPPLQVRIDHDHYSALIARDDFVNSSIGALKWRSQFGDGALAWIDIPDDKIVLRPDNPTKAAIVCFSVESDHVWCFVPWDTGG